MPRKRDRWTRDRAKRDRPKTLAPQSGWLLAELAQLAEIPLSTVQYYVRRRLLRPLEFRGTATRYSRRDLLVLLGLRQLEAESKSTLTDRKRQLDALSEPELERRIASGPISTEVAAALGLECFPERSESSGLNVSNDNSGEPGFELVPDARETWQRIFLLPGLELMLRADAQAVARITAQRICSDYAIRRA